MPSPRVKLSAPLGMRQVANLVGWTDRRGAERMKRRLLKIEKRIGECIMTRQGEGALQTRYFITLVMLRKHLPEMFDVVEERRQEVVEAFRGIEKDAERAEEKCIDRYQELRNSIRSLKARVATLERARANGTELCQPRRKMGPSRFK